VAAELRKMIFSENEVRAALINFALRNEIDVPQVNIEEVVIGSREDFSVAFRFAIEDQSDVAEVAFTHEQVAAAMILYCRTQDIPLPRIGKKVVTADKGSVVMMISLNWPP
jgi:hypothetical protein